MTLPPFHFLKRHFSQSTYIEKFTFFRFPLTDTIFLNKTSYFPPTIQNSIFGGGEKGKQKYIQPWTLLPSKYNLSNFKGTQPLYYWPIFRDEDPVFGSWYGSGALGPDLWKIFKIPFNRFLDNLQVLFYVFLIFCVRSSIDALDPENLPGSVKIRTGSGSRALRLAENVWHQKYENKKRRLAKLSRIFLQKYFKYLLSFGVQSPGPEILPKPDPHPCLYLPLM